MTRRRKLRAILIVMNLLFLGVLLTLRAQGGRLDSRSWVAERIRAIDLTDEERRWERIGWVTDVSEALELSQRHQRPALFMLHVGELDGRC